MKNKFVFNSSHGFGANVLLASCRRSVSWGTAQKTVREKVKKAWQEEAKLTKGPSAYL